MLTKRALEKALATRKRVASQTAGAFDLSQFLFKEQLAFVEDPAPFKVAVCSRRAGKTMACAAHLIHTAYNNPDTVALYITLSRNNAKKIIWKEIKKINREYNLGGVENLSELSFTFPHNNSVIYLSGAKDTNEIEKFRGLAIKLVYIDEGQSFRAYIKELIDDVLAPALMDYAGTLCLIGTPGPVPAGFFYEAYAKSASWSKHHWTFFDNPFIIKKSKSTHQQMLDRELKRRGVKATDPSIEREWFGKWTNDSDSLLLHYSETLNDYDAVPNVGAPYHYIMGVDLGYNDADAIAVLAWSEGTPVTYVVDEIVTEKQGITELVQQIEDVMRRYPISKIVMDEGGLGKKIAEEIRRQKGIPVQGADKKLKMQNIAFLNDAMRTERFKAKRMGMFAQDCFKVEIDRDRSTPDRIAVSTQYHSDIIDAVLYAFKESPSFSYQAARATPKPGTKEWVHQQEEEMWENTLAQAQKDQAFERYNQGDGEWD